MVPQKVLKDSTVAIPRCFSKFSVHLSVEHPGTNLAPELAYSDPFQTSEMEIFVEIVNGYLLLTIFAKSFILDVWQGSEYASKNM